MSLSAFIYLASLADALYSLSFAIGILSVIAFVAALVIVRQVAEYNNDGTAKLAEYLTVKRTVVIFFVSAALACLIPTDQELYAMYGAKVLSDIAESPAIQQTGKDAQDIVHNLSVIIKGIADETKDKKIEIK